MEVRNPLDQNNQSVNITRPESRAVKAVKLDIVQTLSYTAVPYLGQAVGGGFLFLGTQYVGINYQAWYGNSDQEQTKELRIKLRSAI